MAFPDLFLCGRGVDLIGDFELVVLWGIGASLHSIVVGAGGNPDNIPDDVVVEMNIYDLFAEVVFNQLCQFFESSVVRDVQDIWLGACNLQQLSIVDSWSYTHTEQNYPLGTGVLWGIVDIVDRASIS